MHNSRQSGFSCCLLRASSGTRLTKRQKHAVWATIVPFLLGKKWPSAFWSTPSSLHCSGRIPSASAASPDQLCWSCRVMLRQVKHTGHVWQRLNILANRCCSQSTLFPMKPCYATLLKCLPYELWWGTWPRAKFGRMLFYWWFFFTEVWRARTRETARKACRFPAQITYLRSSKKYYLHLGNPQVASL